MIINRKFSYALRTAFASAIVLATVTVAKSADYEFTVTKTTGTDAASTIELIDASTGQVIPGAEINVVQTSVRLQQKGVPNIQRIFIPLQAYLNGQKAESKGTLPREQEVTLMARVPGEFWPVWRRVDLGN